MFNYLIPLALFISTMAITPGPNNLMMASSGATFGFRKTLSAALGASVAFAGLQFAFCMGLSALFSEYPLIRTVITLFGVGYMLYLAWRVSGAGPVKKKDVARPLSFLEMASFQLVNVKAWISLTTAATAFSDYEFSRILESVLMASLQFTIVLAALLVWASIGVSIRQFLTDWRLKVFNITMAASLALIAVWVVVEELL